MSSATNVRSEGPASSVRPGAVVTRLENELRDLWSGPPAPGELPKSRVCTMNLVVVVGSEATAAKYVSVVDEVTRSIPARAFVVALDPKATEAGLDGDVSAVCSIDGKQAICSERIRLTARGAVCERVASAVEALLVPELPTALVWLGKLQVEHPVFVGLAAQASRVILDTDYTSLQSLMQAARWARSGESRPPVADLAWTRLSTWKDMCARFFDEPRLRGHARHVTRLELTQASDPGTRLGSEGALLLGWFASRLGWEVRHGAPGPAPAESLSFGRPDGGTVSVKLTSVPRPAGVAPAALAGVAVEAERDGLLARGTLERELASGLSAETVDADVLVWRLAVGLPCATEQRVRLGANKGARLLERTLHRPAVDPALAEAVVIAEELEKEGAVCT